jgi:hypothetical protein
MEFVDDGLSALVAAPAITVQAKPAVAIGPEFHPASALVPAPTLQRKCTACEEEEGQQPQQLLQRRQIAGWPVEGWSAGPIQAAGLPGIPGHGGGAEMPEDVRAKMEAAFGMDFSPVRVHEGPHAEAIGALAYTRGTDIHFAPGQYQPRSQRGQELLGHELTHVVQQSQGRVQATTQAKGVDINDDAALEREADEMGARAARGKDFQETPHRPLRMSLENSTTQQVARNDVMQSSALADIELTQVVQQRPGNASVHAQKRKELKTAPWSPRSPVFQSPAFVQRLSPSRDEMLAALRTELAAAATDPERYKEVAVRLNGFNTADIKRLTAGLSVEQMRGTRAAVERFLVRWPAQQTILDALDAGARAKGAALRPLSRTLWAAYSKVSYEIYQGESMKNKVWEFIGGSIGKGFENRNTCATRVS